MFLIKLLLSCYWSICESKCTDFENIGNKIAGILFRPQCVDGMPAQLSNASSIPTSYKAWGSFSRLIKKADWHARSYSVLVTCMNTLRPSKKVAIYLTISHFRKWKFMVFWKFVPKGPIYNKLVLVGKMAWHQKDGKSFFYYDGLVYWRL